MSNKMPGPFQPAFTWLACGLLARHDQRTASRTAAPRRQAQEDPQTPQAQLCRVHKAQAGQFQPPAPRVSPTHHVCGRNATDRSPAAFAKPGTLPTSAGGRMFQSLAQRPLALLSRLQQTPLSLLTIPQVKKPTSPSMPVSQLLKRLSPSRTTSCVSRVSAPLSTSLMPSTAIMLQPAQSRPNPSQ